MSRPQPDPELWETSEALISESRRARVELDTLWRTYLQGREQVNDHCLSFLCEARARLEARETARAERAHRALDQLF